jgi:hypothetical protein
VKDAFQITYGQKITLLQVGAGNFAGVRAAFLGL